MTPLKIIFSSWVWLWIGVMSTSWAFAHLTAGWRTWSAIVVGVFCFWVYDFFRGEKDLKEQFDNICVEVNRLKYPEGAKTS